MEHYDDLLKREAQIQTELDRRVFYLKTLYDVSKDIFSSVDFEVILRNFLLMTMGNFGVIESFILTTDDATGKIEHFVSMGFHESDHPTLKSKGKQCLLKKDDEGPIMSGPALAGFGPLSSKLACAIPFTLEFHGAGLLGLGNKSIGEPYSEDDKELLVTLVNNLAVALRNARSFEEIKGLNEDLQEKNLELEETLKELQAALRKVEILESVKANLSKFVPTTVTRLMDESPDASNLDTKEQDVSLLFLDIEGYTELCERVGRHEISDVVETCFSVFMDAIYENNGDVTETAGDGLMVLFQSEDQETNAQEAVRTALSIREKAAAITDKFQALSKPLVINMGINSGSALVGAARFDSYTGSRWTYTARGTVTNIAARIGSLATGGSILLSEATAERVKGSFSPTPRGKFKLKNVSEEVELFSL